MRIGRAERENKKGGNAANFFYPPTDRSDSSLDHGHRLPPLHNTLDLDLTPRRSHISGGLTETSRVISIYTISGTTVHFLPPRRWNYIRTTSKTELHSYNLGAAKPTLLSHWQPGHLSRYCPPANDFKAFFLSPRSIHNMSAPRPKHKTSDTHLMVLQA